MRILIVGCGRNGAGLAQALCRMGHLVTVIDSDASAFKALGPAFRGETVEGIGFDRDVLAKAKIDRADALAAFTSSDESNAVIARMAREIYRVPRVLARLYDKGKAEIYRHLGVQTLSSTVWGIKRATDLLCYSPLNSVFSLGSGDADIVEMELPALMAGHKVSELTVPGEISVTAILRENRTILPFPGMILQKGDLLYITAMIASSDRLRRLLGLSGREGI